MRRYIKNQLLQLIGSMEIAEQTLEKRYDNIEQVKRDLLLTELQQNAIDIGLAIENSEGVGTEAVIRLEEYCELLWQCSQTFSEEESARIMKQLSEKRLQVTNLIRHALKETLEVVFLPYKASMWDSLESVWRAAIEDTDVEAYVVPIPYYDLNPDRSFGQMHYEGDEYPDYVPVVAWTEYDIELRKPDIIFIHNPYDSTNYVTSVPPNYYSSKLKKNTDMLVYIPYFILMDDNVAEHFCVTPATIFADKVIVQSEKVKETYIKYFKEWVTANQYEKVFGGWEKKFLALGSPKIDKVVNTRREDCIIPEHWQRLIESESGTRKKVIFYNTTAVELLEGNERILRKIKDVLALFKNRSDVVLLWRPHPLNTATCASMRPRLLEEYHEIVTTYKLEGWGIYDDTPDLNRAIAISDAYYGARSSVVELYKVTGKPVMIQEVGVLT